MGEGQAHPGTNPQRFHMNKADTAKRDWIFIIKRHDDPEKLYCGQRYGSLEEVTRWVLRSLTPSVEVDICISDQLSTVLP